MANKDLPLRKYHVSDNEMIHDCSVTIELFHNDKSDFENFDAQLNDQFENIFMVVFKF